MNYFNIILLLNDRHQKNGENWLFKKIDEYTNTKKNCLRIPKKKNVEEYKLQDLKEGQFKIAYVILKKIKEWLRLTTATMAQKKEIQTTKNDNNGLRWYRKKCTYKYIGNLYQENI